MRENECSLPYGFMERCRYSERSPYLSSFLDFFSPSGEPSFLVSSAKPIAIRCSAVCLSTERTSPLAMKLPWIVVSVRIRIRGIYSPMDLRIARAIRKSIGEYMPRIRILTDTTIQGNFIAKGEVRSVDKQTAEHLIAIGFAEDTKNEGSPEGE